ncbi:MAG: hypothetical protein AAGD01_10735 [Acidobacteriota bacterium]
MNRISIFTSLLTLFWLLPSGLLAESGTRADRQLAGELAASLALVTDEARRFADTRDELARSRLRIQHRLENNLLWIQEGYDFDRRRWEADGEEYRVEFLQRVLDETNEIATRREAAVKRAAQQQQQLAAARSAVLRRTSQLEGAAAALAALAEPPPKTQDASAFVTATVKQLAAALGEESPQLKQALGLAEKLAQGLEIEDQQPAD